ncbi:MAG: sigma-54 interaction domain-containing protein [Nitrospinales bacterium]
MTRKARGDLDTALNVLNEAVFIYDENMEIQSFNDAAERITGFKKQEVIGKKCVTLFRDSVCLNNCGLCMMAKNQVGGVGFQSSFFRKNGGRRLGQFNAGQLWKNNNGQLRVLVALTDITEMSRLKQELKKTHSFQNMIGWGRAMQALFCTIQNIALFDSTVLLQGESGTGKELVAGAIHNESPRAGKKLMKVNGSTFSDNLLESELFGHTKGAFTGAVRDRIGRFEACRGGTLFLDEVGDLSINIQIKLLRVIQEREIERVGENFTRKVDIRLIAATNKNLLKEVEEGRFRQDLYYRLNVIPIHLPSLRERKEDIPYLVQHFIKNWKGLGRKKVARVSPSALRVLMDFDWPGNVRELENAVEHACVKCAGNTIGIEDLPMYLSVAPQGGRTRPFVKALCREKVLEALKRAENNKTLAARLLGVHRITLWRKMRQFNITE